METKKKINTCRVTKKTDKISDRLLKVSEETLNKKKKKKST